MDTTSPHFLRVFLRSFAIFAALLLLENTTTASAQTTQANDLSSPKQTIATMFAAVSAADGTTLKRVFLTDTPQSINLSSAFADLIVAGRRLRESVRFKFSPDTPNPAMVRDGTTPGNPPPEQAAQLAAATVEIDGASAVVHIPDRPMPIKLRKVDDNWLIDLADFASANPQQLAEQAEIDHSLAAAMQETADEITAGKYASAQEAESAVQQKIHAVIAPQLKMLTTMPTSAPTSAPTTAP